MGPPQTPANRRGEPRVPFDGAVRLRYRLFQEFLSENAGNISAGGMFIRTRHPGEPGSELDFEVRLEDDFTLIQGRGEVAWVRREGAGPEGPSGMGIRFLELEGESRSLVDKIVGERVAAGLELFDLAREAPAAEAGPPQPDDERAAVVTTPAAGGDEIFRLETAPTPNGPVAAPAAASVETAPPPVVDDEDEPPGSANLATLDPELPPPSWPPSRPLPTAPRGRPGRATPLRIAVVAALSALLGAGAMLLFQRLYVEPSIEALETPIEELAGGPGGPWRPPAGEPRSQPPTASAGEPPAGDPAPLSDSVHPAEVIEALRGWAAAWSGQRVDDYLAFYAAGFVPPDGLDRPAWEAARRARIERPEWIRVALTLVEVEPAGPDTAEVRFVQSYRSERYNDLVKKRLRMVREGDAWKIAVERTER